MTNQEPLTQLPDPSEVSPVSTALRYGLIGALASIAVGLVFNLAGLIDYGDQTAPGNLAQSFLGITILTAAMVLAIKQHRDEELGGYIKFGRAFKTGFLTGLFLALASTIWVFIFFSYVQPDVVETIREIAWDQAIEDGTTEEQMEQGKAFFDFFTSPLFMSIAAFFFNLFISVIIGLITAAVMKKE